MSPAVFEGRLVARVGGVSTDALAAFEVATGKELWSWELEGPSYASPVLATFDGVPQIVTQTREHVLAVSADATSPSSCARCTCSPPSSTCASTANRSGLSRRRTAGTEREV